jgi:hypothetical protein
MTLNVTGSQTELQDLKAHLISIIREIEEYQHPVATPPILETIGPAGAVDGPQHFEAIPGLRALKDAVRKDLDVICKVGFSVNAAR